LGRRAEPADLIEAWNRFSALPQLLGLPMAPVRPIRYLSEPRWPQPRLHRDLDRGMAVCVGRLRSCRLLDYRFVVLSHNAIRGAAGGAILNAELMVKTIPTFG
jgi:aspartate-semialdehyde dehydrogenase